MNNEKFSAIMGLIVPEVIRLITENYPYDEVNIGVQGVQTR